MLRKLIGLGLLAAVAGTALPAAAQETIKIGVLTDRTGGAKFYAEPVTEGIILGFEEINAKGGILGKKVELIIEDDQNVPDVSATKARKLVDSGVVFMMSNSASPVTLQASTVSMETKTPHMTPANSADFLTTRLNNPYFWQTGPLASQQFATLMSFVKARNFKRVALVTDNSELGLANAQSFRSGFEKLGNVQIVADEVIPGGTTTAIPQMQKIRAANVDAIFQAGVLGPEMALFFKAYHELGLKQSVLGSYNLSIPAYLTIAKDLMEGVAFIDGFDQDKPEAKKFIEAYRKRYNKDPFSLHAYGYDAAYLVADAITRAGSTDKEKIRAAMQATKGWSGAVGAKGASVTFGEKRAGFDPNGAVVRIIENNNHGKVVHSGAM